MATTPYFGWTTPNDTDLVKNGASAIRTTANAIDTSMKSALNYEDFLFIRDEKASGTGGGTFTSGAWRTRDLNTVKVNNITGASLASNQITLPAGTYWVEAKAPAYSYNGNFISNHKVKLRNITDSSDALIGDNQVAYANITTVVSQTYSMVQGQFNIAGSKVFELQHQCAVSGGAGNSFGVNMSFGVVEVYSEIKIWKVG